MKTKNLLFIIFCITLFSLGFLAYIVFNIDPFKSDFLTISMLYISVLSSITGLLTLIGFYIRVSKSNNEVFYHNFLPSLRQALLIGIIITGLLALRTINVLSIWDGMMLALAIILIELYFQNKHIDQRTQ